MRKKIFVTVLAMSLVVATGSSTVFAQTTTEASLKTAEQLKEAIQEKMEDGVFSKTDQEMVLRSATDSAVSGLLVEKMDAAVELLETEVQDEMYALPDGSAYASHSYDLGDHCKLIVELQDRAETEYSGSELSGAISPMATSGSTSEWKAYGNRYFTAKATVECNVATVSVELENHYALSVNGIDERNGVARINLTEGKAAVTKETPTITDSSARTPGSSDVNMYCGYTIKVGSGKAALTSKYRINTTVKYLSHDTSGKQIKVEQTWSLKKIS